MLYFVTIAVVDTNALHPFLNLLCSLVNDHAMNQQSLMHDNGLAILGSILQKVSELLYYFSVQTRCCKRKHVLTKKNSQKTSHLSQSQQVGRSIEFSLKNLVITHTSIPILIILVFGSLCIPGWTKRRRLGWELDCPGYDVELVQLCHGSRC